MIVIQNHSEHVKHLSDSLAREESRLAYLKRCEKGEQGYTLGKKSLATAINVQIGKIEAYREAIEVANGFALFDENIQTGE